MTKLPDTDNPAAAERDSESPGREELVFRNPFCPPIHFGQIGFQDDSSAELLLEDKIILLGGGMLFGLSIGFSAAMLLTATMRNAGLGTVFGCVLGSLLLTFFNVAIYRRTLRMRKRRQHDGPSVVKSETLRPKLGPRQRA